MFLMVERARGKGNLRTETITMYCVLLIATVVLKIPEKSLNSNIKSVINLDNIKVFRRFNLYIRGILKGI